MKKVLCNGYMFIFFGTLLVAGSSSAYLAKEHRLSVEEFQAERIARSVGYAQLAAECRDDSNSHSICPKK